MPSTPQCQSGKADPSPTATSETCALTHMPLRGAELASAETLMNAWPQQRVEMEAALCAPAEAMSISQRTSAMQVDEVSKKQDEFHRQRASGG